MQKNRRRTASNHSRYTGVPLQIDMDTLATMSDEELMERFKSLDADMASVAHEDYDATKPWEEELSYVRREQLIRRGRRDAHERYLSRLDNDHYSESEASLPVADLDNSSFLELVN